MGFPRVIGEDYSYPFRNVVSYFEADDATFVNLEGTLTDKGNPADKTYTFRGSPAYSHILTDNSVEVVTLANNHSFDYGQAGYDSTRAVLEEAGIPYGERDSGVNAVSARLFSAAGILPANCAPTLKNLLLHYRR